MGWGPNERRKHLDEFDDYVNFYEEFFKVQAGVHFVLAIVITAYIGVSLYLRRKLTLFVWVMLTLILII